MMGMKSETTIYVKGMRKRTEGGGYAGMPNNLITIEQCDSQRTITINDKKKLYYIEPFSKQLEEVIEEEEKPSKNKPVVTQAKTSNQKGGVVTMWYNITDTGERKKMYGITARRIWTTQKIKPSADACMMKDSMIIKTDGWYIDLPQFNCPVRYAANNTMGSGMNQLDCKDRFITRRSGKGKLGFPLIEKRTMIMGDGTMQTAKFETDLETLELSTAKLDSMLFEIPLGYALAKTREELEDKMDAASLMEMYGSRNKTATTQQVNTGEPTGGVMRIGILMPIGNSEQLQASELQAYLVNALTGGRVEAVSVTSAEDAKKNNCELLLTSNLTKVKAASKVGGFLKAIKNADPSATPGFTIEAQLSLLNVSDGAVRVEKKVSRKFDGNADNAAKKALEEGSRDMLSNLN